MIEVVIVDKMSNIELEKRFITKARLAYFTFIGMVVEVDPLIKVYI